MAVDRLTARGVRALLKQPGTHADGRGLYLVVGAVGQGSWVQFFISPRTGKRREMGLGSVRDVSLAEARTLRDEVRRQVRDGLDPIDARTERRAKAAMPTLDGILAAVLAANRRGWRSTKHANGWETSLRQHCAPILDRQVDSLSQQEIVRVLADIWTTIPVTAGRIRARLEILLDYAIAHGHRPAGDNPATLNALVHLLPAQGHTRRHHAALAAEEAPALFRSLQEQATETARCLLFALLTGARSGEARGACWEEIAADVWTIPAYRMKANRAHRVPLTAVARACLGERRADGLIFRPQREGQIIAQSSLRMCLHRAGFPRATVHGLRATFSSWANEHGFRFEAIELSLAHTVGNAVERSYNRADLWRDRVALMTAWSAYLEGLMTDNVLPLKARS